MKSALIKGIVILPGTVLVFVPSVILWLSPGSPAVRAEGRWWIGLVLAAAGLMLATWTAGLFLTLGRGTPVPWAPPRKLVVAGPYRHVRNPMITGVLLMLAAESLLFGSWPVAVWMLVFFLIHAVYLARMEEPGLERRFGEDYRRYKTKVPRWIPRVSPWYPS